MIGRVGGGNPSQPHAYTAGLQPCSTTHHLTQRSDGRPARDSSGAHLSRHPRSGPAERSTGRTPGSSTRTCEPRVATDESGAVNNGTAQAERWPPEAEELLQEVVGGRRARAARPLLAGLRRQKRRSQPGGALRRAPLGHRLVGEVGLDRPGGDRLDALGDALLDRPEALRGVARDEEPRGHVVPLEADWEAVQVEVGEGLDLLPRDGADGELRRDDSAEDGQGEVGEDGARERDELARVRGGDDGNVCDRPSRGRRGEQSSDDNSAAGLWWWGKKQDSSGQIQRTQLAAQRQQRTWAANEYHHDGCRRRTAVEGRRAVSSVERVRETTVSCETCCLITVSGETCCLISGEAPPLGSAPRPRAAFSARTPEPRSGDLFEIHLS